MRRKTLRPRRALTRRPAGQHRAVELSHTDHVALEWKIRQHEALHLWHSHYGATHWLVTQGPDAGTPLHVAFGGTPGRIVEVLGDGLFLEQALHFLVQQGRRPRRQVLAALQLLSGHLGLRQITPEDAQELIDALADLLVPDGAQGALEGCFAFLPRQPLATVGDADAGSAPTSSPEQVLADSVGISLPSLRQDLDVLRCRGYVRTRTTSLGLLFVLFDRPASARQGHLAQRAAGSLPVTPQSGAPWTSPS